MIKRNVLLCQVNASFGSQAFLPYSVGMLEAFCLADSYLADNYSFEPLKFLRDPIESLVRGMRPVDVLGLSCYIWNWQYNKTLAKAVKARYPKALIVMGGPQVPLRSSDFFREHPYVDILVHHEGEEAFAAILRERLAAAPDYSGIPGLSIQQPLGECLKTPARKRVQDLGILPSPYLTGVFNDLIRLQLEWSASHETNRGCPYSCAFCDWGSAVFTQVRYFDDERLKEEIAWFGRNHIDIVYSCDANFGIVSRDLALAKVMAATRHEYGFPKQFRAAYAKKSNNTVFEIASELRSANLARGVTLSLQSLDEACLTDIGRRNIKLDDYAELLKVYRANDIATYTELILGLPGETCLSFKRGIHKVLSLGQHEGLLIYMCELLPNSHMAEPNYALMHGLRTVSMPAVLNYTTPSGSGIEEYVDIVIQTATMEHEEWRHAYLLSWAVQCFHSLNLSQSIAIFLWNVFGMEYWKFYEELLAFCACNPNSVAGLEYSRAVDRMNAGLSGRTMCEVIDGCGDISWQGEEASFLRIVAQLGEFYDEMLTFVYHLARRFEFDLPNGLATDFVRFQAASLVEPFGPSERVVRLQFNIHEVLAAAYTGHRLDIRQGSYTVKFRATRNFGSTLADYALGAVRYGRKDNHLRREVQEVRPK